MGRPFPSPFPPRDLVLCCPLRTACSSLWLHLLKNLSPSSFSVGCPLLLPQAHTFSLRFPRTPKPEAWKFSGAKEGVCQPLLSHRLSSSSQQPHPLQAHSSFMLAEGQSASAKSRRVNPGSPSLPLMVSTEQIFHTIA